MPLTLRWEEIALRLAFTIAAGALVGFNRREGGHAAGLRTTLLVCLTASVAMIQANLLLATRGKPPDSFATLDPMRLPLGVLTGMGFIGGGVILRRGSRVHGVTTAATMWLVTVIGLAMGAGHHGLGIAATALAMIILWILKRLEAQLAQARTARLSLVIEGGGPSDQELQAMLLGASFRIRSWDIVESRRSPTARRTVRCELRWTGKSDDFRTPDAIHALSVREGVKTLRWII